jgi:hypothetical protein
MVKSAIFLRKQCAERSELAKNLSIKGQVPQPLGRRKHNS